MRKILITISGGFVSRNILRSGVLGYLLDSGASVVLLSPEEKLEYYRKEFTQERVSVVGVGKISEVKGESFVRFLAKNSVRTGIIMSLQKEYLYGTKSFYGVLVFLLKRFVGMAGFIPALKSLIRFLDLCLPPKVLISDILRKEKPDVVFATNVIDDLDVAVLREAKRLCLRTVGMVKSWDNLTGHGLIRIVPDILIVHSPWLHDLAWRLHKIPKRIIKVVGIPQYDLFFEKKFLKPREEFLRSLGFEADSRLIFFGAIGTDFAPYEWEIPQMVNDAIEAGMLPESCKIVARPHPNLGVPRGFEPNGKYTYIDMPAKYIGTSVSSWEMEKDQINHFANLLYHADVVVTGASTITMDAAIFDRPIVNYAFDGNHQLPYEKSVRRCYEQYTHYVAMVKTGGARLVYSKEEMVEWIKKYLDNPSIDQEGRKSIIEQFVGYKDGRSAQRVARMVLNAMPIY